MGQHGVEAQGAERLRPVWATTLRDQVAVVGVAGAARSSDHLLLDLVLELDDVLGTGQRPAQGPLGHGVDDVFLVIEAVLLQRG